MLQWLQRNNRRVGLGVAAAQIILSGLVGAPVATADEATFLVNFGSCLHQDKEAPILDQVLKRRPDLFLMLGDNIYSYSGDMRATQLAYDKLLARKSFRKIMDSVPVLAVWDDNDYGLKDGGAEFLDKAKSKELFLKAFEVSPTNPVRAHSGLYQSYLFGSGEKTVQLLLLDTRWFRSALSREESPKVGHGPYKPTFASGATVLGEEQWNWLRGELLRPAKVRIVATSIQLLSDEHGYESWGNFPAERERLFNLLRETKAEGVVFVSGDRHHAELSRFSPPMLYPLYDLTASSLNVERPRGREDNRFRIGERYLGSNLGEMEIAFAVPEPEMVLRVLSVTGEIVLQQRIPLRELTFRK